MKCEKYYKDLNIIRLLALVAVLLYHFNILKGGYLAVCTFLVLTSYLAVITNLKKEKFSILEYYKKLIFKTYLPMVIVVFLTILVVSFLPDVLWLNLKPEVNSILLGYNNFWQLSANLDYFARHINSPFMHLWYMAILIQFDIIFPFIYLFFKKLGDKIHKIVPIILTLGTSILSMIYFIKVSHTEDIMISYYDTFTRMFSLWFGLFLGFLHGYYKPLVLKSFKEKPFNKIMVGLYFLLLIVFFVLGKETTKYYAILMVLVTLISLRLIDYAIINAKAEMNIFDKIIKSVTGISYEIYLLQYPIIFIFQYVKMNEALKIFIIFVMVIILAYILKFALSIKKGRSFPLTRIIILIPIVFLTLCGVYRYITTEDHTKEMQKLEELLVENEKEVIARQKEYASKIQEENNNWESVLQELKDGEKELDGVVKNLSVVGVGDSVMLGAVDNLYNTFVNGYFDAKISRTAWSLNGILQDLKDNNLLGEVVVLNLGANGDCSWSCKQEIMETIGEREVFWVNTTNLMDVNATLVEFAKEYNNLHVIDWYKLSRGHEDYFYADKIHLTPSGRVAYTEAIYNEIYNLYLNKYKEETSEIIKNHEEEVNKKLTFMGGDDLLNLFTYMENSFGEAKYLVNKDYNFRLIKEELEKGIKDNTLTNKIVLMFDRELNISKIEYQELITICKDKDLYIVNLNNTDLEELESGNVKIIDFYQELKNNDKYLMIDKVHLSKEGNEALNKLLEEKIMENEEESLEE